MTSPPTPAEVNARGTLYGVVAYGLWGFFPIYWKWLQAVPAAEILVHRMAWSLIFVAAILAVRRDAAWLPGALADRGTLLRFAAAAALLSGNWLIYIWGVNNGFIVETSLGYFINPLLSVLLGVGFLQERLRPGQWLAIVFAAAGVLYLAVRYGSPPWIALSLATSFGIYGLLKKQARLTAVQGLAMETGFMALVAIPAIVLLAVRGNGALGRAGVTTTILLIASGAITAVPLLLFAAAARRIPLSMLGILQYLAPSLQLLIGVLIYGEPFPVSRLVGFTLIWVALAVYTMEGIRYRRRVPAPLPP